jgi:hypothetical protein
VAVISRRDLLKLTGRSCLLWGVAPQMPGSKRRLTLSFEWDVNKAALVAVHPDRAAYHWQGFDYSVTVTGAARMTSRGWSVGSTRPAIEIQMAQAM